MLDEKLTKYSESGFLAMHMPGHKRNVELLGKSLPYDKDITEIDGFDDLHHATGIIKEITEKAERVYHVSKSFLLVNGSTCGILAGIRSACSFGDKVLVARGCHKSVYHAIELNHLNPIYLDYTVDSYGIVGAVSFDEVKEKIEENPDITLLVLTTPTYEGIISNICKIVSYAHSKNIIVLVDEAHGAHLPFMSYSSYEAIKSGADLVIMSLHKTLPALTQTALLHVQGSLVKQEEVARQLSIFETSSPSYLLMDSIELCLDFIDSKGKKLFLQYEDNLKWFYEKTKSLKHLKIYGNIISSSIIYDYGKIVILTKNTNISGKDLANILREKYKIEVEMSSIYYVIAMSSVCDTKKNFERLLLALKEIDSSLIEEKVQDISFSSIIPKKEMSISEALSNEGKFSDIKDSIGCISQEYLWVYPPGIPIIAPGEIISQEVIRKLDDYQKVGIDVISSYNQFPNIKIIKR